VVVVLLAVVILLAVVVLLAVVDHPVELVIVFFSSSRPRKSGTLEK